MRQIAMARHENVLAEANATWRMGLDEMLRGSPGGW